MLFAATRENLAFAVKALDRKITRKKEGPTIACLKIEGTRLHMATEGKVHMEVGIRYERLEPAKSGLFPYLGIDLKQLGVFLKGVPKKSVIEVTEEMPFIVRASEPFELTPTVFKDVLSGDAGMEVYGDMSGKDLVTAILKLAPFDGERSNPLSKYAMSCLRFEVKPSVTVVTGCDGYRLGEYTIQNEREKTGSTNGAFQIPISILNDFRKVFTAKTLPVRFSFVKWGDQAIGVTGVHDDLVSPWVTMLVPIERDEDGKPYEVFPSEVSYDNNVCDGAPSATVTLPQDDLEKIMREAVEIALNDKENRQPPTIQIVVRKDDSVEFIALSRSGEEYHRSTMSHAGKLHRGDKNVSIALNPKYVLDSLQGIAVQNAELNIWGRNLPVTLCDEAQSYRTLILPVTILGARAA